MKIVAIEDIHCDAGWRNFSFLKVTTDSELVGWSEYNESFGSGGLTHVIRRLARPLVGREFGAPAKISAEFYRMTRTALGGVNQQAIAAIEHAMLDLQGKYLGVPVSSLFGGQFRTRIPVYWSHCGTYRVDHADAIGCEPIRSLDDIVNLGKEVAESGFKASNTNLIRFEGDKPWVQGLNQTHEDARDPEGNISGAALDAIDAQMTALRQGAGSAVDVMLDVNFFFKPEGLVRIGRRLEEHDIMWLECECLDAGALARVREKVGVPVASGEALYGREAFVPFLERRAIDVAVIDVIWNGFIESFRMAATAEAFGLNVAPHNCFGPLANAISAHFAAAVPNLRIQEMDVDTIPWQRELLTTEPEISGGRFVLPDRPGWGFDVNEEAVRAHPVQTEGYSAFTVLQ